MSYMVQFATAVLTLRQNNDPHVMVWGDGEINPVIGQTTDMVMANAAEIDNVITYRLMTGRYTVDQ